MEKLVRDLTISEFEELINNSMKEAFENIIEDLLALNSPKYLASIAEARQQYKDGKYLTMDEFSKCIK